MSLQANLGKTDVETWEISPPSEIYCFLNQVTFFYVGLGRVAQSMVSANPR